MEKENLDILKTIEQEMDTDVHPFLKMILDNIKAIGAAVFLIVAAVAVPEFCWNAGPRSRRAG